MSALYNQRLSTLKKELALETAKRRKKKKKFTPNQQIMIDFINNVTTNAVFNIKNMKIILKKGWGDGKGIQGAGFQHILEKHYCKSCPGEITLQDILNIDLIISKGIELNKVGVSGSTNRVFRYIRGLVQHNIILKSEIENELVVSFYSIN